MKRSLYVFVIGVVFVSTKGQCPSYGNIAVTSCEGLTKYGTYINIDFSQINKPCTCLITSAFTGDLLVSSPKVTYSCFTHIKVFFGSNQFIFGCPIDISSTTINVRFDESVDVRAEYKNPSSQGKFVHCLGLQQNGGLGGNLSVICGSPPKLATTTLSSTTISRTTLTSTQLSHAYSAIESSIESTSVVNTIDNTDVTLSSSTTYVSYDNHSLSVESTQDDPKMLYIVAGSAGGGAIILVGLIVLILVLIIRTRRARNKNGSTKADMARTNEVFDSNPELPDNPLYLSSQPMDELGYSSDQEKQLGLPPTDSKPKKKINSNYDVPPNNKPIDNSASSMPVYAVPKRSKDCTSEVSSVDVYAEVCKPNRSTAHVPVRKRNEEGILYMEVEQDTAATKQTNTNDKNEITEGVCYAEIKRT